MQLIELGLTRACITAFNGAGHTMLDVGFEDFLLDRTQRRLHRAQLREDVAAIALLVHHAQQSGDLALDALEARKLGNMTGV